MYIEVFIGFKALFFTFRVVKKKALFDDEKPIAGSGQRGTTGEKREVPWDNKSIFGGSALTWGAHGDTKSHPHQDSTHIPPLGKGLSWPAAHHPRQPDPPTGGQLSWEAHSSPQGWLLHPS